MRLGELHLREDSDGRWVASLKYANNCEMSCWSSTPTLALEALSRKIIDDATPEYITAWDAWMASALSTSACSQSEAFCEWWTARSAP